jgi:hypothetical protein
MDERMRGDSRTNDRMRVRTRRGPLFASAALLATAACGITDEPVKVVLAPDLVFPRGLLDGVAGVRLDVYEASGLGCDSRTGQLTGVPAGGTGKSLQTVDLATTLPGGATCPSNGKFCGTLTIVKSDEPRLFRARAWSAANADVADGCTREVVNQDALPLKITMVRNVPPSVCGDGAIGPIEQCEPPDPTCDESCHTKEQHIATLGGSPANRRDPRLLWPTSSGNGGRMIALFTDYGFGAATPEIGMRVMSDAFAPLAAFPSSTYLPNDPVQDVGPSPRAQSQPAGAVIGTQYFVVFQDDDTSGTGPDIHMRSMDSSLVARQGFQAAIKINGPNGDGEANIQSTPAVAAGPNGALLIAWQDDSAQKIAGRTWHDGVLGPQRDISSGTGNERVELAAAPDGWIAVWAGGGDVKMRSIDATGAPIGGESIVNLATAGTQDHPSVAMLPNGRFLVVWSDHEAAGGAAIVGQRFTETGSKVVGDQATPIGATAGADQIAPSAAATNAVGGSFIVAWLDDRTKHVRARLLGGSSGYMFNNVDGTSGDFQVTVGDGRSRAAPTVVVGGASPFVAVGWIDVSESAPYGVFGRRFPLPSQ